MLNKCLFACFFALSAACIGCGDDSEPVRACYGLPSDFSFGGKTSVTQTAGSSSVAGTTSMAGASATGGSSTVEEVSEIREAVKTVQCF